MSLLVGTATGVYRSDGPTTVDAAEHVLDVDGVWELAERDGDVFAASTEGLYVTTDGGGSWDPLDVPGGAVWSVHVTAGGHRYAGCYPAALFGSRRAGDRWEALSSLDAAPDRPRWYSPGDDHRGRIRTIRTVPDRPGRLLVGVEVGGLYVSDDAGSTWACHSPPVDADVHHVCVRGPDEYLVSCGKLDLDGAYGEGGVFRTTDGGGSWERLDLGVQSYVRETLVHDGTLYVSGARVTPGRWAEDGGAQAALLESDDDGASFRTTPYPGKPQELVLAWAVHDGRVVGGTGTRVHDDGRVIWRSDDGWNDAGCLPGSVHSMTAI